jgi:hypothetical protein
MAVTEPASPSPSTPAQQRDGREQRAYAAVLTVALVLSLGALVVTFGVYATGLAAPHVPVEKLPCCWNLCARDYMAATGAHGGWFWVHELAEGDYMNYAGMVLLAAASGACYLRVLPIFLSKRDWVFAGIVVAELVIMVLAASGVVGGGH